MNKSVFVFSIGMFMLSMSLHSQSFDNIYEMYDSLADREHFSSIYISPRMFGLFSKDENKDSSVDETVKKLTGLRILSSETPVGEESQLYDQALALLSSDREELMTIKEGSDRTQFFAIPIEGGDLVKELIMISRGEDGFFMMIISGVLSLDEVADISESLEVDVQGFDKLREVDKKP